MRCDSTLIRLLRDRQGSMLALLAVSMVAVLAIMATAVDIGLVYVARAEAQRAADAAALAGMRAFIENPEDPDRAVAVATEFGRANAIRGAAVGLRSGDVRIRTSPDTAVHVEVHRTRSRGNAVPTLFAGLMGIRSVDVSAQADAAPSPSGTARCFKPFLVVDAWHDANGNGAYDKGEFYDARSTGYGSDHRSDGYSRDVGRRIIIYGGSKNGGGLYNESWYGVFSVTGERGGNIVREQIRNPDCEPTPLSIGQLVLNETGANRGPIDQAVSSLTALDPGARWDESTRTIIGSIHGENWVLSPRIGRIALFAPSDAPSNGRQMVPISNFATVFIEGWDGKGNLTARILPTPGEADECSETGRCAASSYFARLVR